MSKGAIPIEFKIRLVPLSFFLLHCQINILTQKPLNIKKFLRERRRVKK